jgi:HD superfamily phosphohydrolase
VRDSFGLEPEDVLRLLQGEPRSDGECILCSLLSSPIDVDKMDYLFRDSLHAGVPYGRNYDAQRLIDNLCVGRDRRSLAITEKGRTAAEMMVFARYIMFSEVYWHHAVRAATAMLQRAFYELHGRLDVAELQRSTDAQFLELLRGAARETPVASLVDGLFGCTRRLYKRWVEFNFRDHPQLFRRFAQRPYAELCAASRQLSEAVGRKLKQTVSEAGVLIDAPPAHLEIQFNLDVWHPRRKEFRALAELSPVVAALATHQFDDLVKRVRVFVAPELRAAVAEIDDAEAFIAEAVELGARREARGERP